MEKNIWYCKKCGWYGNPKNFDDEMAPDMIVPFGCPDCETLANTNDFVCIGSVEDEYYDDVVKGE